MEVSLKSSLIPNIYVLKGIRLTIRTNEDDCLNENYLNSMPSNDIR